MAYTFKGLGQTQLADSATTVYTVPADTTAIVQDMHLCNNTGNAVTVTVWLDIDGTTATDATVIISDFSIPANDFWHWRGRQGMTAASTIKALGSTTNAITMTVSGTESA